MKVTYIGSVAFKVRFLACSILRLIEARCCAAVTNVCRATKKPHSLRRAKHSGPNPIPLISTKSDTAPVNARKVELDCGLLAPFTRTREPSATRGVK